MGRNWPCCCGLGFWLALCAPSALADGKVFAPSYHPVVEIPDQRAILCFADAREQLTIEASFLGRGTNFAWVVPLPSVPEVQPASPGWFDHLQSAFQPRLVHPVTRYYLGVVFLCGWLFLGWRSLKDEIPWVNDLPLCVLLAAGMAVTGRSVVLGGVTMGMLLYVRVFTASATTLALGALVGLGLVTAVGFWRNPHELGLVQTMGEARGAPAAAPVTVLARQRAGLFDTTTIRGSSERAVMDWLEANGFAAPPGAAEVFRQYVQRQWVFVAAKVRREQEALTLDALHPLTFTFATPTAVYPLQLTGVGNSECSVDLYVFADQRAAARYFSAVRCDWLAHQVTTANRKSSPTLLRVTDAGLLAQMGRAKVGTKLSAKLSPARMTTDAEIQWSRFTRTGAEAYSPGGAVTVALNVAIPLGVLAWVLVGACRGGWGVDEAFVRRWRRRLLWVSLLAGLLVFAALPKVQVVEGGNPAWIHGVDE